MKSLQSGGKHEGKGIGPYDSSMGASAFQQGAASTGTSHGPNTKDKAGPGGCGSRGTASKSAPSKG